MSVKSKFIHLALGILLYPIRMKSKSVPDAQGIAGTYAHTTYSMIRPIYCEWSEKERIKKKEKVKGKKGGGRKERGRASQYILDV